MNYQIYNEDCLVGMKKIADGSVDLILDDLPFGTTDLPQDKKLPVDEMWKEFLRVTKANAAIVLFSQMPFGAELITSNLSMFRHEWIYQKALPTGFLNANKMPMRIHENILVFYRHLPTYNPQWDWAKPYKAKCNTQATLNYRRQERRPIDSDGRRYPTDVLKFKQPIANAETTWHPQQKPVEIMEYLIRT
ncbi:MAG: site-specific DNA-methyltransferase, partial [Selenomonadaceae bacterium]|nr:site-specific DNA-methyltransferase [Selenomonadaceae bacterium]